MEVKQALKRFFEEKRIENQIFEVKHNGTVHFVESEFLQELIVNHTPTAEQKKIREIIVKIDFLNGDVNHFLKHLAKAYVVNNF